MRRYNDFRPLILHYSTHLAGERGGRLQWRCRRAHPKCYKLDRDTKCQRRATILQAGTLLQADGGLT